MSDVRLIDANALWKTFTREIYDLLDLQTVGEIIDNAPTIEPKQEWISCEERLPEIKEHYVSEPCIVYCEGEVYGFAELEENIFGQVGWNCERDDDYHEPLGTVIAWMPLPAPYTEESSTVEQTCETCKHYTAVSVECDRCDKCTHSRWKGASDELQKKD